MYLDSTPLQLERVYYNPQKAKCNQKYSTFHFKL